MKQKICIVGLGYVGLPLAVHFGRVFENVLGFDINKKKIEELKQGNDATKEITSEELKSTNIEFTSDPSRIKQGNFIIIAVPTPVNEDKTPNLECLESASSIVGKNLSKDSIVVFESTVYPGTTEEVCLPILEKESGLKCGKDFKIGYSPERINPGDKEHTIDKIFKVVSGMDEDSLNKIAEVYSKVAKAGVYKAKSIKVAEAAKVIENIQRDINIALMNELSLIFSKIGIDTKDVLDAASTKWNFHKYTPGCVGGHCIGIDPYYLAYKSKQLDHNPEMILAGRKINESMAFVVADKIISLIESTGKKLKESKVLILGLTFKENVTDTRNSKVIDIISVLKSKEIEVFGFDPLVKDIEKKFGIKNHNFKDIKNVDCVVVFSPHKEFNKISLEDIKKKMDKPILVDIKNFYSKEEAIKEGFKYYSL